MTKLEFCNGDYIVLLMYLFHYYELTLRVIIYLFTVESVYIHTCPAEIPFDDMQAAYYRMQPACRLHASVV